MSHVRRLRLTGRIFFVNVNLRPRIRNFVDSEYPLIIEELEASRRQQAQSLVFQRLCGFPSDLCLLVSGQPHAIYLQTAAPFLFLRICPGVFVLARPLPLARVFYPCRPRRVQVNILDLLIFLHRAQGAVKTCPDPALREKGSAAAQANLILCDGR